MLCEGAGVSTTRAGCGRGRADRALEVGRVGVERLEARGHLEANGAVGQRRHRQQQRVRAASERPRYVEYAGGEGAAEDLDAEDGEDEPEDAEDEGDIADGGERADERLDDELHRRQLGNQAKGAERAQGAERLERADGLGADDRDPADDDDGEVEVVPRVAEVALYAEAEEVDRELDGEADGEEEVEGADDAHQRRRGFDALRLLARELRRVEAEHDGRAEDEEQHGDGEGLRAAQPLAALAQLVPEALDVASEQLAEDPPTALPPADAGATLALPAGELGRAQQARGRHEGRRVLGSIVVLAAGAPERHQVGARGAGLKVLEVELGPPLGRLGRLLLLKGAQRHRRVQLDADARWELFGLPASRRVGGGHLVLLAIRHAERIGRVGPTLREPLHLELDQPHRTHVGPGLVLPVACLQHERSTIDAHVGPATLGRLGLGLGRLSRASAARGEADGRAAQRRMPALDHIGEARGHLRGDERRVVPHHARARAHGSLARSLGAAARAQRAPAALRVGRDALARGDSREGRAWGDAGVGRAHFCGEAEMAMLLRERAGVESGRESGCKW